MPADPRARTVWEGSWTIPARTRGPPESDGSDCPQAFHALNETRADLNLTTERHSCLQISRLIQMVPPCPVPSMP